MNKFYKKLFLVTLFVFLSSLLIKLFLLGGIFIESFRAHLLFNTLIGICICMGLGMDKLSEYFMNHNKGHAHIFDNMGNLCEDNTKEFKIRKDRKEPEYKEPTTCYACNHCNQIYTTVDGVKNCCTELDTTME